eukprot:2836604-Karenia_brevis.AAC.1
MQKVPTEIHNRFQSLTRDDDDEEEDEEEKFEECREIPSLVSSEDEEERPRGIPSQEDLESMRKVTGWRERRKERTRFREAR